MKGRTNVGGGKPEEEKTVTAGTSVIEVNPSSGKVMKKVTVNPTPTESKEVTAGTSDITVSPTDGKHFSGVTVHPTPSQEKTVIPTAGGFKVSPDTGKLLSAVFVDGDSDLVGKNIKQGVNIFGVDGSFDNSHGAYVWKKSTKPITLHFTQTSGAWGTPITLQVTSSEIDVNTLTGEDFVGVKGTCGSYTYEFTSATKFIGLTYTSPIEYSYSNGVITIQGTISSVVTWSDYTKEGQFLDYIVSDSETAYPDGGEQGGYWYERVVEGVVGIDFGEVTLARKANSVTVNHNLGVAPSWVLLVAKDVSQVKSEIFFNANGDVFYNAGTYGVGTAKNTITDTKITFNKEDIFGAAYLPIDYYWVAIA